MYSDSPFLRFYAQVMTAVVYLEVFGHPFRFRLTYKSIALWPSAKFCFYTMRPSSIRSSLPKSIELEPLAVA